ncbi:hypothetical protein EOC93_02315 [Mesorhizobium sp. M6A.T.Ce.TU.002.03.1.1]|uniref:hypothetical protein n=1 Tax=Mesorhizobium sp. M6A.T.Ce.TU.002.03.1.1 TaxID=2496782 RepID=UPI000FCB83AF|nr:hypothetical protein [Mesorhizobium sp. M6A.T.Ce.TU.002.03.1.1]RUU46627.1 hypothetical protein EOC93_02315 [Mesorhizobium sp. M6A.T.Ce.TU.002.03.1.1]
MALNPILAALTFALSRKEKPTSTTPVQQKRRSSTSTRRDSVNPPFMSAGYLPTAFRENPIDDPAVEQKRAASAALWRKAMRREQS